MQGRVVAGAMLTISGDWKHKSNQNQSVNALVMRSKTFGRLLLCG